MIINMGSGGENLKKEITEQSELIEAIRKLYVGLKWTHEEKKRTVYSIAERDGELFAVANGGLCKWDGSDWDILHSLGLKDGSGTCLIAYKGTLQVLGGIEDEYMHVKLYGNKPLKLERFELPTSGQMTRAVVHNDKIHMFTQVTSGYIQQSHYSYDGSTWTEEVVFNKDTIFDVVSYDGKLYAIGNKMYMYREGQEWDEVLSVPANVWQACVFDDELYVLTTEALYRLDSEHWVKINSPMTADESTRMIAVGDELVMINSTIHAGGVFDGL